jgi:predicted O-methyltransferase YrrM
LTWREVAPGAGPSIDTSLTLAETERLRSLAADADVLEIGSAYGYSAIVMALAGASVLAVDPHVQMASFETMMANLGFYQVADRVTIRRGDSRAVMPQLADQGRRFDLVWIDGDHAADMVEHDVSWARKLLKESGTLVCHDYDEDTCPGVKVALDKLFGGPGALTDTMAVYGPGQW